MLCPMHDITKGSEGVLLFSYNLFSLYTWTRMKEKCSFMFPILLRQNDLKRRGSLYMLYYKRQLPVSQVVYFFYVPFFLRKYVL